jgi:hypothetical protein
MLRQKPKRRDIRRLRRFRFIGKAIAAGIRWAYGALSHALNLIGLFALIAGLTAAGVALDQPFWFIGGLAVVLGSLLFIEGAYRVWHEADTFARAYQGDTPLQRGLAESLRDGRELRGRLEPATAWTTTKSSHTPEAPLAGLEDAELPPAHSDDPRGIGAVPCVRPPRPRSLSAMSVTGTFWPRGAGHDIHLVPGLTSPRLDQLLFIADTTGNRRADNPPTGVTVTWASNYATDAAAAIDVTVDLTTGPAAATGAVTVAAALAAGPARLLDFLVIATVTEGTNTFESYIRFHVHEGVAQMWLTPNQLTVPEGAHDRRFSVLAEFTDGTYGDITNWSPFEPAATGDRTYVHATPASNPILAWRTGGLGVMEVHPQTGVLDCKPSGVNTLTDISALTVLGLPNSPTARGRALGAPRWDTPVTLDLIAGPGLARIDEVPNVLILGDGFQAQERQAFIDLAGQLVKALHSSPRTRPYDLVKDRMNYFAAFRESREQGVATQSPVILDLTGGAGIPVDVAVDEADAPTLGATVDVPPTGPADIVLLNERDTAFGAEIGERPRAQRSETMRTALLSEHRFNEDDFDAFLGSLEFPAGNTVGGRWRRDERDQASILVLCRTALFGGANSSRAEPGEGHIICITVGEAERIGIRAAASPVPDQDIVPDPIPAKSTVAMRTVAAHELAHSYTIEDEYGGLGQATIADEGRAAQSANAQSRDELLSGRTFLDRLKWRWPRLMHAARLTSPPVLAGPEHRLFFVPGDPTNFPPGTPPRATDFPVGTILRLRTHPLPGSQQSYRLRVTTVVGAAEVFVEPAEPIPAGAPALPATFPADSIVMEPKRGPDPAGGLGDDLELIHADVLEWIEREGNPLNAKAGAPAFRDCSARHLPPFNEPPDEGNTPARNFGPGKAPKRPTESAMLTGLFEAGMQFDCGIYHPTGACAMNVIEVQPGSSYQFCWVCRYAMVDFIDPAMHGLIDRDYDYRYPP